MLLILFTAFLLGAAHAVAPDHLAAVGVFVSRARSPREALAHGAHWGMGHAFTLLLAGLGVLFIAREWPTLVSVGAEWLVGVVLIALGARAVHRAIRWTSNYSAEAREHSHRHPLVGIGMLHGLAGSGAMASIVPLGSGQQPLHAIAWLVLFGIGTTAAMAFMALMTGWSMRLSTRSTAFTLRGFVGASGAISIGVGVMWLARGW